MAVSRGFSAAASSTRCWSTAKPQAARTIRSRLLAALDAGRSLIFFPEGTRNTTEAPLLPFKSGLYRIATQRPEVELIPVWIENLNRVMPKGEFVPMPLLCTVTFGAPIAVEEGEGSLPFRERSRAALLALAPSDRT